MEALEACPLWLHVVGLIPCVLADLRVLLLLVAWPLMGSRHHAYAERPFLFELFQPRWR